MSIKKLIQSLRSGVEPGDAIQEYLDDLTEANDIPLGRFCRSGGEPDEDENPDFQVNEASISGAKCSGNFTVMFREKWYGGGCPDMPSFKQRQGDIKFCVDLTNGNIEFS